MDVGSRSTPASGYGFNVMHRASQVIILLGVVVIVFTVLRYRDITLQGGFALGTVAIISVITLIIGCRLLFAQTHRRWIGRITQTLPRDVAEEDNGFLRFVLTWDPDMRLAQVLGARRENDARHLRFWGGAGHSDPRIQHATEKLMILSLRFHPGSREHDRIMRFLSERTDNLERLEMTYGYLSAELRPHISLPVAELRSSKMEELRERFAELAPNADMSAARALYGASKRQKNVTDEALMIQQAIRMLEQRDSGELHS